MKTIGMAVDGIQPKPKEEKHLYHCAEYLRQSVMCSVDPTLERPFRGVLGAFEANNTHICNDFDALRAWANEHRYTVP
jgi:hypothetical protein